MSDNKPPVYETPWYGHVLAAVWEHEGQNGNLYGTTLVEHFNGESGWRSTKSISTPQLGNVSFAVADAANWIARTKKAASQERRASNG